MFTTSMRRQGVLTLLTFLTALPATGWAQQLPDPFVVPRGALRVSFEPSYANFNLLFDTDGEQFALGRFFSADPLGTGFLPTLATAEAAARSLTGDASYVMNAGRFTAKQDGDIRWFPFDLSVGISNRLTLTATLPIVTTRIHSATSLDTTGANVGWNQVAGVAENATASDDVAALLGELQAAITAVEAELAAGTFGCPSTMCDLAQEVVARATALAADVQGLTGVSGAGELASELPPFAPLAASPEGVAIASVLAALSSDLQTLGQTGLAGTLPLPTEPLADGAVNAILTGTEFGYAARTLDPEDPAKLSRFGDARIGLRLGVAQRPSVRLVIGAAARLPTGFRDLPNDYLDIGTGDRQLDLEWTVDGALEPGNRLGLWFSAAYTLQLSDRLDRRIARADAPIAPVVSLVRVERNLGDVFRASVNPLLRLNDRFRVFLSAAYFRKGADAFTMNGQPVPALEALTERQTWSFGAGLWYRTQEGRRGRALPIEAGVTYRSAFSGTGGATPKSNRLTISLRLFYTLWGAPPPPPPPVEEEPAGEISGTR